MSNIFKFILLLVFIISSKSEIEYGSCINNKRSIKLEDGSIKSLDCIECPENSYTKYENNKLICASCPEHSYNYGHNILIDTFSEKLLKRHSFEFYIECTNDDKKLCPKWVNNILSLKVENAKENIDSKSILKFNQYYMNDGKFKIKYINYNGDINKYLHIYINKDLVYKDDTKHSKIKTVEFTIKKGNNDIEIQYIIDKNIPQENNKDIEAFFEIYEIEMTNAEVSSLECQKYDDMDKLKNSIMNNCDYYIDKCDSENYCTFRFYVEQSEGSNFNEGSQTISYKKINGGNCNELFQPLTIETDAEQCSYGQFRKITENEKNNNTYTCDECTDNKYNNKIINYEFSCPEECDTNKKQLKKISYINKFEDQSQHEMNINITDIVGYVEINYEKFNLRENAIIFIEIEDININTNKTYQLINPDSKTDINDGNFEFKLPLVEGEYIFKIKGKNLKLKNIKIINGNEGGNYLCVNQLVPEDEPHCENEQQYYSPNQKKCLDCPNGSFIKENSKCAFTEQIISNKFILENNLLFENKLLKSDYVIEGKDNNQYHLYLYPSFPLIYSTKSNSTYQILGNEFEKVKLVKGINNRGIILSYTHKDNDFDYISYLYIKCSKSNSQEKIEFIKEETEDNTKYVYFTVESNLSCPYCLESEIEEVATDGKCSDDKKELFNVVPKNSSECVIKPYNNNSESSKIILDDNSEILLFHNSSLTQDKKLINYYQIKESIPLNYGESTDKIVTETQRYKECENGPLSPLYIVLIAFGACIVVVVIIIIIIKVLKSKRTKTDEEGITGDSKEMKLKASAFDD